MAKLEAYIQIDLEKFIIDKNTWKLVCTFIDSIKRINKGLLYD